MTKEEQEAEIAKCKADPYYYYITYWRLADGSKPNITREQYEMYSKQGGIGMVAFRNRRR